MTFYLQPISQKWVSKFIRDVDREQDYILHSGGVKLGTGITKMSFRALRGRRKRACPDLG